MDRRFFSDAGLMRRLWRVRHSRRVLCYFHVLEVILAWFGRSSLQHSKRIGKQDRDVRLSIERQQE